MVGVKTLLLPYDLLEATGQPYYTLLYAPIKPPDSPPLLSLFVDWPECGCSELLLLPAAGIVVLSLASESFPSETNSGSCQSRISPEKSRKYLGHAIDLNHCLFTLLGVLFATDKKRTHALAAVASQSC